jgi:hypothetical protein
MVDSGVIQRKYGLLKATMTERARRLWAGAEADAVGYGGVARVAHATGLAISTVRKGRDEVREGASLDGVVRDRRPGGGRYRLEKKDPKLKPALEHLVDPTTRGDPESPLRWTCKSTRTLARELTTAGHPVSPQKVGSLLRAGGYSLQGTAKVKEGKQHPDRNAQFEYISSQAKKFMAGGCPVISVDAKKKEQVGEYDIAGREWQPKGQAVEVLTYDFVDPKTRDAIPYGIYDIAQNKAYVNVGTDHNTATFAARSVEKWWELMGRVRYPNAKELFITADAGGSNGHRSLVWKARLQELADRHQISIHVSHFPPGTSKWNKIEHRLFSFITLNWRGRPLTSYETIVSLISSTRTTAGLEVQAELDLEKYEPGIVVSKHIIDGLALRRSSLCPAWNYTLRPRTTEQLAQLPAERPKRQRHDIRYYDEFIRQQIASGMKSIYFCRQHGLAYDSFLHARRKLLGPLRVTRRARTKG